LWLAVHFALAGCNAQSSSPSSAGSASISGRPVESQPILVDLQLNWRPEAEHGGYYAALVHGEFAAEGLQVTIKPGGPEVPVMESVATGRVMFGVDNADKLLRARAEDADLVAVFAPIQNSPRCLMVHEESGIRRLEDLSGAEGITLAWNPIQPFAIFLKKKLDLSRIQMTRYAGTVGPFLLDKKYVQQAYNISEPYLAIEQGARPVNLMLSDVGFNPYTSVLLTSRDMLTRRPEVVRKMVRASQRGWQKYLVDPAETNRRIAELNPEMPTAVLEFGAKELRSLCLPDGLDNRELGRMESERWETLARQLEEIEVIAPGAVKAGDAFTTEFVPAAETNEARPDTGRASE
jgi:NitT/TauT family transport system substrate-binding protein